jgi:general transcription factor 3C polypeptide 3 (transcription factor C subunit 4)
MASDAYMDGRIDDAIEWVEDAIRINAEIFRAWRLLATLLEEKGDLKKSFTARVFSCHLEPKAVEGWLQTAEIGIALRDILPQDAAELLEQASVCYSAALRADITNTQARHGRAAIAVERRQLRTAAKDYLYLLEHCEYDVHALRSYAEMTILLASTGKRGFYTPESAIERYYRAFAYFRANGIDGRYPLEWQDVNIFVGLLAFVENTKDALYEVKSLSRWLLGRSDESFWDDWQDDDREWDVDNVRRIGFEKFQEGRYPELSYGHGLPFVLRTKLAVYRLKLGDLDEAGVSQPFQYTEVWPSNRC